MGIDFTEQATRIAQTTYGYRHTFAADCTDEQAVHACLNGRTYPAVFCCEVFHYVHPQDYQSFFRLIHAALQPAGHFLFMFPNLGSLYHKTFRKIALPSWSDNFKYQYQLPAVIGLLNTAGFDVVVRVR